MAFTGLPNSLSQLVETLRQLPGVGRKSAERLAYHMVRSPSGYIDRLIHQLQQVKEQVRLCATCFNLTEQSRCAICRDEHRDRQLVCVVEGPADVAAIEATNSFRGLYHVLHGALAPLDGDDESGMHLSQLRQRILSDHVTELILATNNNVDGEATALLVKETLQGLSVRVTRLATGIPIGGALIYADGATLARALTGRQIA